MEKNLFSTNNDTICAVATPGGSSAISIIRISGKYSIDSVDSIFKPLKGPSLKSGSSRMMRFGSIYKDGALIDEVLVVKFISPFSFTGEDSAEIYCHGSQYIRNQIMMLLFSNNVRQAKPGEFSMRAYLNGKMDLSQAEAIADLISSETSAAHRVAINQMKGGFSNELYKMRSSLLNLVSLMELELDFSEEDVEFADRDKLKILLNEVKLHLEKLIDSFALGNVIKNGIPVAIVGATNTGKSTLLNSFLGEERAIVSDIHGTTRDFIEDIINISGIAFRFIDTAGIRKTDEKIEIIGIERTFEKIKKASVIILVLDSERPESFTDSINRVADSFSKSTQSLIIVINKTDSLKDEAEINFQLKMVSEHLVLKDLTPLAILPISAKNENGINELKDIVASSSNVSDISTDSILVTNIRHQQALILALDALVRVEDGIECNTPTDLLTQDIREALFHLGEIVGEINTEEILGNIFTKFCIGK